MHKPEHKHWAQCLACVCVSKGWIGEGNGSGEQHCKNLSAMPRHPPTHRVSDSDRGFSIGHAAVMAREALCGGSAASPPTARRTCGGGPAGLLLQWASQARGGAMAYPVNSRFHQEQCQNRWSSGCHLQNIKNTHVRGTIGTTSGTSQNQHILNFQHRV